MLLKVSELNDVEKKELITFTQGYLFEEVTHFVETKLVDIVSLYVGQVNKLQKRGYICLSVIQPDDEEFTEEERYRVEDGLETHWKIRFIPYHAVLGQYKEADHFLNQTKADDPYKMPVVFCDTRSRIPGPSKHRSLIADEMISMCFWVNLSPYAESVVKDQQVRKATQSKPRQQPEQKLEDQLYDWLRIKGVDVERQVVTTKHRLDLWIPSKAMLELKQGRVSGDDVCQAIDYAATYQMPIVLVGTGLSSAASRGIDAFNRAMGKDLIIFVTWGGVRPYLNGLL